MENKKDQCYTNFALETSDMSLKPQSNNNISVNNNSNNNNNTDDAIQQPVVFEDLPHNPSVLTDKIELFWISLALYCGKLQTTLQLVKIAVLYHCYFFGAMAYFIQNKVSKMFTKINFLIYKKNTRRTLVILNGQSTMQS